MIAMPAFRNALTYWVGTDTPDASESELEDFNRYTNEVHVPDVLAAQGFSGASRYELVVPDREGLYGPRWLTIFELDDSAGEAFIKGQESGAKTPASAPPPPIWQSKQVTWRTMWKQSAEKGASAIAPEVIFTVAMDVPTESAEEVEQFDNFYTNTHIPEVMEKNSFVRATRYERLRTFGNTEHYSPQFCGLFEGDAKRRAEIENGQFQRPGPPLTAGPPVWDRRKIGWRLVYKRIS